MLWLPCLLVGQNIDCSATIPEGTNVTLLGDQAAPAPPPCALPYTVSPVSTISVNSSLHT